MKFIKPSERPALCFQDQAVSYTSLLQHISAYAQAFSAEPESRIIVFSENRPEWVYAFYSIWQNQCIPVPLDFMSSSEDVAFSLADCRPSAVFCSPGCRQVMDEAVSRLDFSPLIIDIESIRIDDSTVPAEPPEHDLEKTAVILYTSGTTGDPKGVMLSFSNLQANLHAVTEDIPIYKPDSRVLVLLPLHHIFPLAGTMIIPISLGGSLAFVEALNSESILKAMCDWKVNIVIGVPRLFKMFRDGIMTKIHASKVASLLFKLAEKVDSFAFSRRVFGKVQRKFGGHITYMPCGGAAPDFDVVRDFRTLGFELLAGYGMTETAPMIAFTHPGEQRSGASGQVMKINEIRIVNEEITVRGPNVMQGYYNRPDETNAILKDGWLHTGDLGYVDADGHIFITGRRKEIIVLPNGKNINPEEIEKKLPAYSNLIEDVAVLMADGNLHALILPDMAELTKQGIHEIEETIRWSVIDKYNRHCTPSKRILKFTIVREPFPRTRLSKLKRHELPALLRKPDRTALHDRQQEPQSREYSIIRDYLAERTGSPVFPGDHLEIDLGLDSLEKVSLQFFIKNTFGCELSDEDIVNCSSIEKISELVCQRKKHISDITSVHWGEVLREKTHFELPKTWVTMGWINHSARLFLRSSFRIKGKGFENLPEGPFILAPNHQSFLDGLLVSIFIKNRIMKKTYFYAKAEHVRKKWVKFLARTNNVIVLDLNSNLKESIQSLASALKRGRNVIIFPEGTRTNDGSLGKFKETFAILGRELNVPIVPVAIAGAFEALPAGRFLPRFFQPIEVTFLPAVLPESHSYSSLADKVAESVNRQVRKFYEKR